MQNENHRLQTSFEASTGQRRHRFSGWRNVTTMNQSVSAFNGAPTPRHEGAPHSTGSGPCLIRGSGGGGGRGHLCCPCGVTRVSRWLNTLEQLQHVLSRNMNFLNLKANKRAFVMKFLMLSSTAPILKTI